MKKLFRNNHILLFSAIFFVGIYACKKKIEPSPQPQGIVVKLKDKVSSTKLIEGAKVTLSSANKKDSRVSDKDGEVRFEGIEIGKYNILVESDEYESQEQIDILVSVGTMTSVLFNLDFKNPVFFAPFLNFDNSNEVSKPLALENKNSKKTVTLAIKVPDNDQSWLNVTKKEIKLSPNFKDELTFIINPKGKEGKNYVSNVILNYSTDGGQTGNSTLTVSMFIPNPQAPTLKTYDVNGIAQTSADVTGNITNAGGGSISERGFCWAETPNPNPETDKTIRKSGGKVGEFTETIEGLEKGKIYYVRAFAVNSFGMGLGDVKKFTTSITPTKPTVLIDFKNIFTDRISLIGKITSDGGGKINEYGFVWNTNGEPKITDNKVQITKMDADNFFSGEISGLKPETEYKIRTYAISDIGGDNIGYSQIISLKTLVPDLSPKLNNFSPEESIFGETITINGANFGTDTSKIRVLFSNNKRAIIKNLTNNQLTSIVPVGAVTGPIKIQVTGQPIAESSKAFTYLLTPYVSTIASIPTTYYINDISQACNGNIYFSAVNINSTVSSPPYPINNSGVFRLNKDDSVIPLIDNVAGNVDGATNIAKFTNPTEITCVNNDVYIADQYDNGAYKSNAASGYSNIRKLSNGSVSTVVPNTLTTKEFIHEMTYIPQLNAILYSTGSFYKYDFVNKPSVALSYDGLTTAIDTDGKDIYTLDFFPESNSTKWTLNKRKSTVLNSIEEISTQPLITPNVYLIGMALDSKRGFVYVVERNKKNNFNIYRIRLSTKKVEIIYDGNVASSQTDDSLARGAKFTSISCIAFDTSRDALLIVDVDARGRNNVRVLEYK